MRWRLCLAAACAMLLMPCGPGARAADAVQAGVSPPVAAAKPAQGFAAPVEAGPREVSEERGLWRDADRGGREVPWLLYAPRGVVGAPLVIFSHGAGGTREGYAYLGRHLASWGIASLHLQHAGSDRAAVIWHQRAAFAGIYDPAVGALRYGDIGFAVRQLTGLDRAAWRGRFDLARLGIAGHSFGGLTVQIIAGESVKSYGQRYAVPAFRAGVIMSPSPPRPNYDDGAKSFAHMLFPLLHLTGTRDDPPGHDFAIGDRSLPFDRIHNVDQILMVIDGATHMTFTGENYLLFPGQHDDALESHLRLVRAAIAAWFMAYLSDDGAARHFLYDGGLAALAGGAAKINVKTSVRETSR